MGTQTKEKELGSAQMRVEKPAPLRALKMLSCILLLTKHLICYLKPWTAENSALYLLLLTAEKMINISLWQKYTSQLELVGN